MIARAASSASVIGLVIVSDNRFHGPHPTVEA